jgi:hypothetical protein
LISRIHIIDRSITSVYQILWEIGADQQLSVNSKYVGKRRPHGLVPIAAGVIYGVDVHNIWDIVGNE